MDGWTKGWMGWERDASHRHTKRTKKDPNPPTNPPTPTLPPLHTYRPPRVDAAIQHDGTAFILENHAAPADLLGRPKRGQVHRVFVFLPPAGPPVDGVVVRPFVHGAAGCKGMVWWCGWVGGWVERVSSINAGRASPITRFFPGPSSFFLALPTLFTVRSASKHTQACALDGNGHSRACGMQRFP